VLKPPPPHRPRSSPPRPGALAILALVAARAVSTTAAPQAGAAGPTTAQRHDRIRIRHAMPALGAIGVKDGVVGDPAGGGLP
jgi:hypothetical protein